jgi:hypothetical protein
MAFWYIFGNLVHIFPFWYVWTKKNLATLRTNVVAARDCRVTSGGKSFLPPPSSVSEFVCKPHFLLQFLLFVRFRELDFFPAAALAYSLSHPCALNTKRFRNFKEFF